MYVFMRVSMHIKHIYVHIIYISVYSSIWIPIFIFNIQNFTPIPMQKWLKLNVDQSCFNCRSAYTKPIFLAGIFEVGEACNIVLELMVCIFYDCFCIKRLLSLNRITQTNDIAYLIVD